MEDHSSPTVAVQVWYHVGSKDDPDKRSGFAHLFEHMMFKGNDHLTADTFDNLTENIGGENNAYTAEDVTVYHEVVPSNYLNPILWAEAERMSSLALNEANFKSERDVVKEEYRQRILANPYGEFYLDSIKNSYAVHPYKRPGIGNIAELDASTLAEVRAFHSTFYRPDNATLVVVGDFQPNELHDWVNKYFGAIKKPSEKIPRVTAKEPPRKEDKADRRVQPESAAPGDRGDLSRALGSKPTMRRPCCWQPRFWPVASRPGFISRSSIEQQIAQQATFSADLHEDLGLLTVPIDFGERKIHRSRRRKRLSEQISKVLREGVTQPELEKAKNRFLTGKLLERETNNGKASALGEAAVVYGDANRVNTDLAKLQAVTAD